MVFKKKAGRTAVGVCVVALIATSVFFSPKPVSRLLTFLENGVLDLELRHNLKPLEKGVPITIIDIDDKSLAAKGRWPWSREVLADLVEKIYQQGARTVAFDFTFPEAEENLIDEVIEKKSVKQSEPLFSELEKMKPLFDFDVTFAKSLQAGNSILGFVFKNDEELQGVLPPPFLIPASEISNQIFVPKMSGYIGNISLLQKAAKEGAFLNATPDVDGVNRFAPLILQYKGGLYASLALEAAKNYLAIKTSELVTASYKDALVLEGVELDQITIPLDPWGRIFIPFRGKPYSIPYISALDVLDGKAAVSSIADKLIFIGSSATAMADLLVTAVSPVFPGVEIHASIALGIIEHYLPYKPTWGKGVSIGLVLILGLFCSLLFPHFGPIKTSAFFFLFSLGLIAVNHLVWTEYGIVLSMLLPVFVVTVLYVINIVIGYFFESEQRKRMKSIFGQYLSQERIELLLQKKESDLGLDGESKELTVLFTDIRNFTTISEKMSASEVKNFLTLFSTPMTQIIFDHKGTIDKYVGDMIMAFWGAPLEDPTHALDAVMAAWNMQKKLGDLNEEFQKKGNPLINVGIGLNTGVMNVGDMGSKFRRSYTVIGDSVNLAARLENLTKFYRVGIIVGEKTQEEAKNGFVFRKLDRVKVRGKEEGVTIYEVISSKKECSQPVLAHLKSYEEALDSYLHKKWDVAEKVFRQLCISDPLHIHLYEIYLDRIAFFRTSPPRADWDGVHIFEEKGYWTHH